MLEQRWYAHRSLRSLIVHEMELTGGADGSKCAITFGNCNVASPSSVSTNTSNTPAPGTVELTSHTRLQETQTTPLVTVGQAYNPVTDTEIMPTGGADICL